MTVMPDNLSFASNASEAAQMILPKMTEQTWGYTISPHQSVTDLTVMLRGVASLTVVACYLAALGIWLVPTSIFVGDAFIIKAMTSILLLGIGILLMNIVSRGTRVRVVVDTSFGQIGQVVDGMFGSNVVLETYGMDAVSEVAVVQSRTAPAFGQIQIILKGGAVIAAGDGSVTLLMGLRDRLARDLGLDRT